MRTRTLPDLCSRSAVAAIEFALILPCMVLLAIGVLDLSQAMILWQETYYAARSIPFSASIISVQPDKTTSLSVTQAQQMMSAIYAEIPWLADGIAAGPRSVTLSSITWIPNGQTLNNCVPGASANGYTPCVTWSLAFPGGTRDPNLSQWTTAAQTRPCYTVFSQTTPTGTPPPPVPPLRGVSLQLTTLRTLNVNHPDPILVADVHVQFVPYLYHGLFGSYDFWASAYASVRTVDPTVATSSTYTKLTPSGAAGSCAGWP